MDHPVLDYSPRNLEVLIREPQTEIKHMIFLCEYWKQPRTSEVKVLNIGS